MTEQSKTIAVAGSSPFALLLAGLLAADHSREIVLVTREPDPNRLTKNISLSVAPITRPQTWAHLRTHGPDALRKIAKIAPDAVSRRNVLFQAQRSDLATGLRHVHHMAAGFGHVVERTTENREGDGVGVMVRDVHYISGPRFAGAAQSWLEKSGVRIMHDPAALTVRRNGAAWIGSSDIDFAVLADDEAIITHLGDDECALIGVQTPMLSVLSAPVGPRPYPVTINLDTGVSIVQSTDGSLEFVGPDINSIALSLEARLAPQRAAQTGFTRLLPVDGAPVIGTVRRGRTYVAAGLGPLDMIFAPLIARGICGLAHGPEGEWLRAHQPRGRQSRGAVAELAARQGRA